MIVIISCIFIQRDFYCWKPRDGDLGAPACTANMKCRVCCVVCTSQEAWRGRGLSEIIPRCDCQAVKRAFIDGKDANTWTTLFQHVYPSVGQMPISYSYILDG
jgi:hypothetical protein